MNKYQKEYLKANIKDEKKALKELEKIYKQALEDIDKKIKKLMEHKELSSKVYQMTYQYALRKQIEKALQNINDYDSIVDYLENCYETGYVGSMYDMAKQGIPLVLPIDQEQMTQALFQETKLKDGLYERLGYNKKKLAQEINQELSRGIANSMSYADVATNINKRFWIGANKSFLIARTEGHRIMTTASYHAQKSAKDKGCDVVKQWDSALDGRTRPSHRKVDGEIRELDEKFSNGLLYPGDPNGKASEVINCRCALLQRATWALDEDELKEQEERAKYYELDKSKNFEQFKERYLKVKNGNKD